MTCTAITVATVARNFPWPARSCCCADDSASRRRRPTGWRSSGGSSRPERGGNSWRARSGRQERGVQRDEQTWQRRRRHQQSEHAAVGADFPVGNLRRRPAAARAWRGRRPSRRRAAPPGSAGQAAPEAQSPPVDRRRGQRGVDLREAGRFADRFPAPLLRALLQPLRQDQLHGRSLPSPGGPRLRRRRPARRPARAAPHPHARRW